MPDNTDTFEENVAATSGALSGDYLWSDAANWSNGVPPDGGSVIAADSSSELDVDDIGSLSLSNLSESGEEEREREAA